MKSRRNDNRWADRVGTGPLNRHRPNTAQLRIPDTALFLFIMPAEFIPLTHTNSPGSYQFPGLIPIPRAHTNSPGSYQFPGLIPIPRAQRIALVRTARSGYSRRHNFYIVLIVLPFSADFQLLHSFTFRVRTALIATGCCAADPEGTRTTKNDGLS